jgi:hypothetical protein
MELLLYSAKPGNSPEVVKEFTEFFDYLQSESKRLKQDFSELTPDAPPEHLRVLEGAYSSFCLIYELLTEALKVSATENAGEYHRLGGPSATAMDKEVRDKLAKHVTSLNDMALDVMEAYADLVKEGVRVAITLGDAAPRGLMSDASAAFKRACNNVPQAPAATAAPEEMPASLKTLARNLKSGIRTPTAAP